MVVLSPRLKSSACSWAEVTYGSTTAYMFFSLISMIWSMRRRSIITVPGTNVPVQPVQIGRNWSLCLLHSLTTACTWAVSLGMMTAAKSVLK